MHKQAESTELLSVDETIDAIAREALEEARRVEEAERYRNNPGPVVPPHLFSGRAISARPAWLSLPFGYYWRCEAHSRSSSANL